MEDKGVQTEISTTWNPHKKTTVELPRWFVIGTAILAAVAAVWWVHEPVMDLLNLGSRFTVSSELLEDMGVEGVILFRQHDRDDDGYLSMQEFEPLVHRIMETNETYEYERPIEVNDEVVTIQTFFQPLVIETMTKDMDAVAGPLDPLQGLKTWKKPLKDWKNMAASELAAFLPRDPYLVEEVGNVYDLVTFPVKELSKDSGTLSSNRYFPSRLYDDSEIMIHKLLKYFHPRPFVHMRFAPQGSVACVRAFNKNFVDIVFRIHAEFQLNDPPFNPYWFTPAQFKGHIIVSKDGQRVLAFHMYVPTEQKLNVDMEWLNQPKDGSNMEVDIGFMPQMEMNITRGSIQAVYGGQDMREAFIPATQDYQESVSAIEWTKELTFEEVEKKLEVKLYPFKKVPYYPFTEVFDKAKAKKKKVPTATLR